MITLIRGVGARNLIRYDNWRMIRLAKMLFFKSPMERITMRGKIA